MILCQRHGKPKDTKRQFRAGPMGYKCNFGLQLKALSKKESKNQVKVSRACPDYDNGNVIMKTFDYEHNNSCATSK